MSTESNFSFTTKVAGISSRYVGIPLPSLRATSVASSAVLR